MTNGLREHYEVLDPTDEASPLDKKLASAVPDLQGKVIGFLDISKPKGDIFLKRLEELLTERYHVKAVMHRRKPTYTAPAPASLREELASRCDVIIEALAD
jgi:hypothetical protein